MPTLRTGMPTTDRNIVYVHALQNMLTTLDAPQGRTDHRFLRPGTVNQVKRFQQVLGRTATGVVDENTWKALQRGCDSP